MSPNSLRARTDCFHHGRATGWSRPRAMRVLLLAMALLAPARRARGAACFATDNDGTYDKDGLTNGVVTVTAASTSPVPPAGTPYDCTGVDFAIASGGALILQSDQPSGAIAAIELANLTIAAGGVIQADGQGCVGGAGGATGQSPNGSNVCSTINAGSGLGGQAGGRGGGGHGGDAGQGTTNTPAGTTYGSATAPLLYGSGGGGTSILNFDGPTTGGAGGGVVRLDVAGTLVHDGVLHANGTSGGTTGGGASAGGGSGGSIFITDAAFAGSGAFEAHGGAGGNGTAADGGGGGGGRIALVVGTSGHTFTAADFDVEGGTGPDAAGEGTKGTVYVKNTSTSNVEIFHGFTYADVDHV